MHQMVEPRLEWMLPDSKWISQKKIVWKSFLSLSPVLHRINSPCYLVSIWQFALRIIIIFLFLLQLLFPLCPSTICPREDCLPPLGCPLRVSPVCPPDRRTLQQQWQRPCLGVGSDPPTCPLRLLTCTPACPPSHQTSPHTMASCPLHSRGCHLTSPYLGVTILQCLMTGAWDPFPLK